MATGKTDLNPLMISEKQNVSKHHCCTTCGRKKILCTLTIVLLLIAAFLTTTFMLNPDTSNKSVSAGVIGKWGVFGGSIKNQQKPIYPVQINQENIYDVESLCIYNSTKGNHYTGYITIDENNYGYFADMSGFIICINLTNCEEIWSTNIAEVLGYNASFQTFKNRQSVTLYQDSNGNKGCLIGTPNRRRPANDGLSRYGGCYALSVFANNGSFWWNILLGNGTDSAFCHVHGFMVKNNYAFGGMSIGSYNNDLDSFRGKFFRINIDTKQIENIWYSFPEEKSGTNDNTSYRGSGSWNFPALIDKYVVFGTANLLNMPDSIAKCILDFDNIDYNETDYNVYDGCGQNRMDNIYWRCLEKDVYPSSLIILEQDTFNLYWGIPLVGVDLWWNTCDSIPPSAKCPKEYGFDYDLAAISVFTMNNLLYAAGHAKSGWFYVFEIESKQIHIAKRIGDVNGYWVGGNLWSLAIDEAHLIAVLVNHGANRYYKDTMADGTIICSTGNIHAINLNNGKLLWQVINPYGYINDEQCNQSIYDKNERGIYNNNQSCVYGEYLNMDDSINVSVHIPPMTVNKLPLNYQNRANNRAPITIANEMVFIPSETGDIFIVDLLSGEYLTSLQCPDILIDEQNSEWDRASILGGVTVVDDIIVFYCNNMDSIGWPAQIISMKLNRLKT